MDPIFEKGGDGEYTCFKGDCVPATSVSLKEAGLAYLRAVKDAPFFDSETFVRMTGLELDFNEREVPAGYSEYLHRLRGVRAQPWQSHTLISGTGHVPGACVVAAVPWRQDNTHLRVQELVRRMPPLTQARGELLRRRLPRRSLSRVRMQGTALRQTSL